MRPGGFSLSYSQLFKTKLIWLTSKYPALVRLQCEHKCQQTARAQCQRISWLSCIYVHISAHKVWTHPRPVLRSRSSESSGHICWVKPQMWSIDWCSQFCKTTQLSKPPLWSKTPVGYLLHSCQELAHCDSRLLCQRLYSAYCGASVKTKKLIHHSQWRELRGASSVHDFRIINTLTRDR